MSDKNNKVVVETSIPLPVRTVRGRPRSQYSEALASINVGESFLYPVRKSVTSSRSCIYIWRRKFCPERAFKTAEENKDGVKHIRVWRVA